MTKAGVVFVPIPEIGHLVSTVEFAKLLLMDPDCCFSVTILKMKALVPALDSLFTAYIESVNSLGLDITFEELPHVDLPLGKKGEAFTVHYVNNHKPLVRDAISEYLLTSAVPLAALVLDMLCTNMIDVADEFNVPAYIYFTSTAAMLSLMLYLPHHYSKHAEGDIDLPGLSCLPLLSVPSIMRDRNEEGCKLFLNYGERFQEAKGIIINTFSELEPASLKALVDGCCVPDHGTPPVFPVGPLLALNKPWRDGLDRHECLKWLDDQPVASVVFLCFGSVGCFQLPQVKEIAEGLEQSGKRFLWSLRIPSNDKPEVPADSNLEEVLPEGFLGRIKERGMVWPSWVPQTEILAHPAVAGFVTHCGWNSILESLWFGVPILGWPLYAEQHLNAFEMGRVVGVALELKSASEKREFVCSGELEKGVRSLMGESEEGKKVRMRVEEMKVASRRAVQAGGSSVTALESFKQMLITGMHKDKGINVRNASALS